MLWLTLLFSYLLTRHSHVLRKQVRSSRYQSKRAKRNGTILRPYNVGLAEDESASQGADNDLNNGELSADSENTDDRFSEYEGDSDVAEW